MAGYVENHLIDNENIVYQARLHWIIFFSWRGQEKDHEKDYYNLNNGRSVDSG